MANHVTKVPNSLTTRPSGVTTNHLGYSTYLFWDVDPATIDLRRDRKFVIRRVADLGLLSDIHQLDKDFTEEEIVDAVITARAMDKKSASWMSALYNIPIEEMRCFILKKSLPPQLNF